MTMILMNKMMIVIMMMTLMIYMAKCPRHNCLKIVLKTRPNWAREVREIFTGSIKGWACWVSGGEGVALLGPRGSRGGPTGCQGVKGWAYRVPQGQGVGL